MADSTPSQGSVPGAFGSNLNSSDGQVPPVITLGPPQSNEQDVRYRGFDLWLHRVTVLMFVFVCAVVGVLLVILPWRPEWTDNRLLLTYPTLRAFVSNGFVRGVCTGLGVLDIWVGFWEAIHYNEIKH
jgi:hypothetical protein